MSRNPESLAGVADVNLSGRTAVVTGATSGIGRETALALARLGADLVVHGRDAAAGERVVAAAEDVGADAAFLSADFADPVAVDGFADAVRAHTPTVDLLVNAAGAHFSDGRLVDCGADRAERTFAVNHLAPFRLTRRLRDVVADDGRVVVVASRLHRRADGSFDVRSVDGYDGFAAYCRSKLANVLFADAAAERLDGPAVASCHPGFVPGSGLWREASLPVRVAVGALAALPNVLTPGVVDTAAEAAATPTWLAASQRQAAIHPGGGYFVDCEPAEPSDVARDDAVREDLWALSESLTGLSW
ncbi:SDR family NAD(P)-dependent oxidoreductase [Halobaculum sp. D14]|uniref:SDR family NAD(P)-dependent oxidoreductase n=1 Tax=Halobaculum sp. D14 TaxID=3421642 RepID=UPI003EBD661B